MGLSRSRSNPGLQAHQWGVATDRVPDAELESATDALVDELRSLSPLAQRTAKKLLKDADDSPLSIAIEQGGHCDSRPRGSEDFKEWVEAFHSKRRARFVGRRGCSRGAPFVKTCVGESAHSAQIRRLQASISFLDEANDLPLGASVLSRVGQSSRLTNLLNLPRYGCGKAGQPWTIDRPCRVRRPFFASSINTSRQAAIPAPVKTQSCRALPAWPTAQGQCRQPAYRQAPSAYRASPAMLAVPHFVLQRRGRKGELL